MPLNGPYTHYFSQVAQTLFHPILFAWRWIQSPREVGTPFSCSIAVAEEMLKHIPLNAPTPRKFLEIGPGTGAFTDLFVKRLTLEDHLDLVEIDAAFCRILKEKYGHLPNVQIHHTAIQAWHPEYQYDGILTAVPLNALPTVETLEPVLQAYETLVKKTGILSAVEYVGTSFINHFVSRGIEKEAFRKVLTRKQQFFATHTFESTIVWKNLPPARIFHCNKW